MCGRSSATVTYTSSFPNLTAVKRVPSAAAETSTQFNRSSIWWTDNGRQLGLEGFDIDTRELLETAQSLVSTDNGWDLPGAELLIAEVDPAPVAGRNLHLELAPQSSDGTIDLSKTIDQYSTPASPGELYRVLFEASDLGVTRKFDIANGGGYIVTDGALPYALRYSDGYLTFWQADSADSADRDLAGLLDTMSLVSETHWESALDAAELNRGQAIDQVAADLEPLNADQLPRYVLPEPWQLESVDDQSLWSDEERLRWRAQLEANQSTVTARLSWVQTFTSVDGPPQESSPDILIQVFEYDGWPAEVTTGSDAEPFSLGVFDGFISGNDHIGTAASIISVRNANHRIEIISSTLSRQALASFSASLNSRSATGAEGFDLADSAFLPGLDGPQPLRRPAPSPQFVVSNMDTR